MRLRPLFFVLLLALVSAGTASAQVVISARIGQPYGYGYGGGYYGGGYYNRGYYPPVAPVVIAAPPVYYAPRPVFYAPRPVFYGPRAYYGRGGYGRGYGRRW